MAVFQNKKTLEWQSQVHLPSRPTPRVLSIVIMNAAYILSLQMARHSSLLKRLFHSRFIGSCISYGGCRSLYRPISRLTVDRHIGRYVGRESVDITAEWCLPVGRDRSTDRSTVGRDIIVSVSAMYWGIVGRVSVRYQWIIGIA